MKKFEITKIRRPHGDKYTHLWLGDGPFSKDTIWDEEKGEVVETENDHWNACCKSYMLDNCLEESFPDEDVYYDLEQYGLNYYVGLYVTFDNSGHPKKICRE